MVSTRSAINQDVDDTELVIHQATPVMNEPPPQHSVLLNENNHMDSDDEGPEEETAIAAKERVEHVNKLESEVRKDISKRKKVRRRKQSSELSQEDDRVHEHEDESEDPNQLAGSIPTTVLAAAEQAIEESKRKEKETLKAMKLRNQIKKTKRKKSMRTVENLQICVSDQADRKGILSNDRARNNAFDFFNKCMTSGVNRRISAEESYRKSSKRKISTTQRR